MSNISFLGYVEVREQKGALRVGWSVGCAAYGVGVSWLRIMLRSGSVMQATTYQILA